MTPQLFADLFLTCWLLSVGVAVSLVARDCWRAVPAVRALRRRLRDEL